MFSPAALMAYFFGASSTVPPPLVLAAFKAA
jgi:hypothetical protein